MFGFACIVPFIWFVMACFLHFDFNKLQLLILCSLCLLQGWISVWSSDWRIPFWFSCPSSTYHLPLISLWIQVILQKILMEFSLFMVLWCYFAGNKGVQWSTSQNPYINSLKRHAVEKEIWFSSIYIYWGKWEWNSLFPGRHAYSCWAL